MISTFFRETFSRPLVNILVFITDHIPGHDMGLAIIILTIVVRLIFFPLSIRAQRSQRALNALNPKVQEIRDKHKHDQAAQGQAIMQLYKENNVSMVAGCLPMLIQIPILFALYQAFLTGIGNQSTALLYPFVHIPETINNVFLGFINIVEKNRVLTIITAALQFIQIRQSTSLMNSTGGAANSQAAAMNKQMTYILPAMILVIGWNLPAGLLLYWITTTLWAMLEQWYISKTLK